MAERIVVKVGTSTLAHPTGLINLRNVEALVRVLSDLKNMGHEVILVSSGAIGVGFGKLGMSERPTDMPSKQAAAAVGQCALMFIYDKFFSEYSLTVAQVLLTGDVLDDEKRAFNAKNTLSKLLEMGAIIIINENDTVSTEEIEFGDNDLLSALVSRLSGADRLVILSDIDGLYDSNPRSNPDAKIITDVFEIDDRIIAAADPYGSNLGTGGMSSKIKAAQIVTSAGINMHIIHGDNPGAIYDILEDQPAGTKFHRKQLV
ncbi:MAG: glutamate 5-kinase [Eubacteriaceae bacterium]|nr:glutamate 5-kinase [Eubacteriaceae bacterium]